MLRQHSMNPRRCCDSTVRSQEGAATAREKQDLSEVPMLRMLDPQQAHRRRSYKQEGILDAGYVMGTGNMRRLPKPSGYKSKSCV